MATLRNQALDAFFTAFGDLPDTRGLQVRRSTLPAQPESARDHRTRIALYESVIRLLEALLWQGGCEDSSLELLHHLYREMETVIALDGDDNRYNFVVVIPLADRPQHLENCLNSLLELCRNYAYGGFTEGHYRKLKVLVADDSKHPENITRHRQCLDDFRRQGLDTLYFGQEEQLRQLERLTRKQQIDLFRVIGDNPVTAFYHKGASITRNITLLKLAELAQQDEHCLYWFLDSDQEFQVNTQNDERNVQAISYFHQLERIFSSTATQILTGKVVGDPPVSPAVMAGNFLQDVICFLTEMAQRDPQQECRFHGQATQQDDDAAYHDLANLFGFQPAAAAFDYRCRLKQPHDHTLCFKDFSEKLKRFFDGEHPTRRTYYEHQDVNSSVKPARTVYTGNYVLRADALDAFIPFASLKLRMAGPVLGRILKADKGRCFVSANLPMLHRRTVEALGQSEFRPDISRTQEMIDLSGEFERQFYGDVMLFSIERLTDQGYPATCLGEEHIRQTLNEIEASLRQKYLDIHQQILTKLDLLTTQFNDPRHWWNSNPQHQPVVSRFQGFIRNIEHNFGVNATGYRLIESDQHRRQRLTGICEAIMQLPEDRLNWRQALSATCQPSGKHEVNE